MLTRLSARIRAVDTSSISCSRVGFIFFFFNDTATTEIYTLSLHDALPISIQAESVNGAPFESRYADHCISKGVSCALLRKSSCFRVYWQPTSNQLVC